MTTNYDIDYKKVIKQSSGLHLRSYTVKKKMSKLIFAQINSAGLLWSVRLRSACVPIHFLKVCCKKTFLLRCSPHVGRLHLLFITSWLYFSSKFQAGVQSAKKPSLCVSVWDVRTTVIPLCKNAHRAQIQFHSCRNISQYLGT